MFNTIKKVIKDVLTENDGESFCPARLSGFIALFSYLGIAVYSVHLSHSVDLVALGTGLATVLAGTAIYLGAKQATSKGDSGGNS